MDFGLYAVIDIETSGTMNPILAGRWICTWDLDSVEKFLNGKD